MKALVTGGAGFIGSHVVDALLAEGHAVYVVDDLSSGKKDRLASQAVFHAMDIRDPNISMLFAKERFDVVFHLAAQIDVRKSVHDPFFDASVNILGTLRLLDCCRSYAVNRFIFSSSGGVMYGECPTRPATEADPAQPISPYGISKLVAERYVRFYAEQYGVDSVILRYGNVYGPRQDPHGEAGVVAIFAGRLLAGEPVTIFGSGDQQRDYVYVKDVAAANMAALHRGDGDVFNIGTGMGTSVNALYERMARELGAEMRTVTGAARAGELERNVLNAAKAGEGLGWSPQWTMERGLKETLNFFSQGAKAGRAS